MLKPLTVWITTNCGKFSKLWEYQTALSVSYEAYMTVKKQQLEPDMEQVTGSKLGEEYIKDVLSLCLFSLYADTLGEMPSWISHKLESRLPGEISITSDMQMTPC